ncbi:MAG: type 4a pilus biogenesis protein PilO [Candidatus Buchananbacteria bacterium]|nr:type 4a pilus biogenesis protein PilO [Candidatus Buchananbacteria bacterium]
MFLNYYKNKFYINIGIVLLFFAAITIFIIYPALKEISRVNQEITNERIKLEKKLAMGLNMKKIVRDLEEIEEPAKTLDNVFFAKGNELNLISSLETIANKYGLVITINSDFTGQDIGSNIDQVEIQAIITGDYKQILGFMSELEKQEKYFNLKLISFTKNKKADNSNTIVAQLIVNTYFKK